MQVPWCALCEGVYGKSGVLEQPERMEQVWNYHVCTLIRIVPMATMLPRHGYNSCCRSTMSSRTTETGAPQTATWHGCISPPSHRLDGNSSSTWTVRPVLLLPLWRTLRGITAGESNKGLPNELAPLTNSCRSWKLCGRWQGPETQSDSHMKRKTAHVKLILSPTPTGVGDRVYISMCKPQNIHIWHVYY